MNFFEDFPVPTPPKRDHAPKFVPPPWFGAPENELPGVVHIGKVVYHGPHRVLAVKSAEVYSTGCNFDLVWNARRGDETDNEWATAHSRFFQHGPAPMMGQEALGAVLLFGIVLPDGSKASTGAMNPHAYMDPAVEPEAPVLSFRGGGGGGGDDELNGSGSLWLWPLPEPGNIRLVAQWPDLGIPECSVILDGGRLRAAAGEVQQLW